MFFYFLVLSELPESTLNDSLFPSTTSFRSRTDRAGLCTCSSCVPLEAYETDPAFRAAVDAAHVDLTKPLERMGKPSERAARLIVNFFFNVTATTEIYT